MDEDKAQALLALLTAMIDDIDSITIKLKPRTKKSKQGEDDEPQG